jgi:heterodisulfide reductase subunit A
VCFSDIQQGEEKIMRLRIGFYICHCGINIAHRVRVDEVAGFVAGMPDVVVARDYKFMCSDPGQALIEKDIADLGLNRVVVASCSPRMHARTFMNACRRAGINPYYFQMASVREQVSWVTADDHAATRKAKTLAAAAVHRVRFHHALETRYADVHPDMLVVGGGIAGMQAALDIADAGHRVHLVERGTTIGGHMLQFDKTFPTLDCAACIGTPKMVDVSQHPHIQLHSFSEVTGVTGSVGNFTVTVRRHARYVKEDACTACGECAKVCPVSIPNPWDEGLGSRKAIGRAFPQSIPITFNIEKKDPAPCTVTCPAGVNVQGYVQLIGRGKYLAALELIMQRLPLPGTLGRICPHPCEDLCRRAQVDSPVAIRLLKRFAADQEGRRVVFPEPSPMRETRVAVVGSGPAGLTAACYLRLKGYPVTLFEASDKLGGMLRAGIPDYRLPPAVLDAEIDRIIGLGIDVRTGMRLGKDFTIEELDRQDFGAIFLGLGAQKALTLNIPGETDIRGVINAVDFLDKVNSGVSTGIGRRVVVIGGGNVAVDAARSALRLGARVTLVYRRTLNEMPAYGKEIAEAEEEGVEFVFLAAPARIMEENGHVVGLECVRMSLGPTGADGRRKVVPFKSALFTLCCDTMIPAVGQAIDITWAADVKALNWGSRDRLQVDPHTGRSGLANVFAAGDMVSGPATVIEAIGAAHRAVAAMDLLLTGKDRLDTLRYADPPDAAAGDWSPVPEDIVTSPRPIPENVPAEARRKTFEEVQTTLSKVQAHAEADRCLNCAVCCECMQCVSACEAGAIDHRMREEDIEIKAGSIILATGYDILDPSVMTRYGYGRFANVFTALEFERLSNATGPTGGRILARGASGRFDHPPRSVALLHCIGSRDDHFHSYCSRVCCMYALKYTHLIKEKVGHDTVVYDFYIDMRCFGEGYEEFYRRCQEEGTNFIRGKVAEITDQAASTEEEGMLIAVAEDTLLGKRVRVPVEMVVLCAAMQARHDAARVGRVFGVSRGADGFFLEEHPKLAPVNTSTDGVFLAGCCQKPMDIPDTVSQASGAAAKALSLAARGKVEIQPTVSHIDPSLCAGCGTCIDLCPYGAISFNDRKMVSEVNPTLCKGCGSCSAACPSGAAGSRHFMNRQIMAEIDGLMRMGRL